MTGVMCTGLGLAALEREGKKEKPKRNSIPRLPPPFSSSSSSSFSSKEKERETEEKRKRRRMPQSIVD